MICSNCKSGINEECFVLDHTDGSVFFCSVKCQIKEYLKDMQEGWNISISLHTLILYVSGDDDKLKEFMK